MANIDSCDNSNSCDNHISSELDAEFSTLSLVNATDMDAFLKVIMSVDEKTAQNIRGDINHLMVKYIDADPVLKEKLIKNDYCQFDLGYLQPVYTKVRVVQLNAFYNNICNSIRHIVKTSYSISNAFDIIGSYVYRLRDLKDFQLTDNAFLTACSKYCHFDDDIKCKSVLLLNPKYTYQFRPVDDLSYCPIVAEMGKLIGISFSFSSEKFLPTGRPIYAHIYAYELSDHTIEQIIKYFNGRRDENSDMMSYKLEDTLAYIANKRNISEV